MAAATQAAKSTDLSSAHRARDEQTLAKANEAIAIRPKRGRLTLLSRRIFNALLYHSQRQGVEKTSFELPLQDLIGDSRFNSNNTEILKSHLRDMQTTLVEWSTSASGYENWESSQLLGPVAITRTGRGHPCVVRWTFPDSVRERLVKANQYTRILLEMGAQMRSYCAAALYEIGARYLSSPARLTMRQDVVWWNAVLTGRSDVDKVDYRFLKRDVISTGLAEIEALCPDFTLELIEHRRGRKVEELQFRVVPKVQQRLTALDDPAQNVFDLELVGRLVALGLKQDVAQELYAATDEGQLRSAIEHVEQRLKQASLPQITSPAAYLRDALRRGYVGRSTVQTDKRAGETARHRDVPPSREEQLDRVRYAWRADRVEQAQGMYEEMSPEQQGEWRSKFDTERLPTLPAPIAKAWRRDGPRSRIAGTSFFQWLADVTWPEEENEKTLFDFALSKGLVKVD